jgi:single-stranded DNA-binding protein
MREVKGDVWPLGDEVKPDAVAITPNGGVTWWGEHLENGENMGVSGRRLYRCWEDRQRGQKCHTTEIIADLVTTFERIVGGKSCHEQDSDNESFGNPRSQGRRSPVTVTPITGPPLPAGRLVLSSGPLPSQAATAQGVPEFRAV